MPAEEIQNSWKDLSSRVLLLTNLLVLSFVTDGLDERENLAYNICRLIFSESVPVL